MAAASITRASSIADSERETRIQLAALYRLLDYHYGCGEGIYNHVSMRLPEESNHFLIKPHSLLFREVTASSLIKVRLDADLDESSQVNRPGLTLHGAILSARTDVGCAIHIHSNAGLAISAQKDGLKMFSQNSVRFYKRLGYHSYQGIVEDFSEREMITTALGGENIAIILRNHGLVTVGAKPRDAFERMRDLIISCETQIMIQSTGADTVEIPPEVCERVSQQFIAHDSGRGAADWPAWIRLLDNTDSSYRN